MHVKSMALKYPRLQKRYVINQLAFYCRKLLGCFDSEMLMHRMSSGPGTAHWKESSKEADDHKNIFNK